MRAIPFGFTPTDEMDLKIQEGLGTVDRREPVAVVAFAESEMSSVTAGQRVVFAFDDNCVYKANDGTGLDYEDPTNYTKVETPEKGWIVYAESNAIHYTFNGTTWNKPTTLQNPQGATEVLAIGTDGTAVLTGVPQGQLTSVSALYKNISGVVNYITDFDYSFDGGTKTLSFNSPDTAVADGGWSVQVGYITL